jgi:hypothetical protein
MGRKCIPYLPSNRLCSLPAYHLAYIVHVGSVRWKEAFSIVNQCETFPKISHTVQYLEVPDWETSWHRTK